MAEPSLMFCVGATKAGTSWLHRYISDHPDCHMRAIKELHYFDAVAFDDFDPWLRDVARERDDHLARAAAGTPPVRQRQAKMAEDAADWLAVLEKRGRDDAAYLAYLDGGRTDECLVGDMTPAYALLPIEWLREMARIRPDVRFVYILRDPVDRMWSHCRMIARRRSADPSEHQGRAVNILKRAMIGKEREIVKRSDYAGPLWRLTEALAPERLHVAFYEELFTDGAIEELCRFLGIRPVEANFEKRIMAGPTAEMGPGQLDQARAFRAEQYEAAARILGALPPAWRHGLSRAG